MSKTHIHLHLKDASKDPALTNAKNMAKEAIRNAASKLKVLKNVCRDADDKSEVTSALEYLQSAQYKIDEVVGD